MNYSILMKDDPICNLSVPSQNVVFRIGDEDILRLDLKGMTYRGKVIEDAGEAYRVFMEVMNKMKLR